MIFSKVVSCFYQYNNIIGICQLFFEKKSKSLKNIDLGMIRAAGPPD